MPNPATDLYPNDGNFFQPEVPEEVVTDNQKEKETAQRSLPVMKELMQWFDAQILEAGKLTNIDTTSSVPIESQVIAFQEVIRLLELKKGELEVIKFAYGRNN